MRGERARVRACMHAWFRGRTCAHAHACTHTVVMALHGCLATGVQGSKPPGWGGHHHAQPPRGEGACMHARLTPRPPSSHPHTSPQHKHTPYDRTSLLNRPEHCGGRGRGRRGEERRARVQARSPCETHIPAHSPSATFAVWGLGVLGCTSDGGARRRRAWGDGR